MARTFTKDPTEVLSFSIDWTNYLPSGVTVSSAAWTTPTGITHASSTGTISGNYTTTNIFSGGTAGQNYIITCLVTGSDTNKYEESIIVRVGDSTAGEPITVEEVKEHLRIDADDTADDAYIEGLITAAREYCEDYQNRSYLTTTRTLVLDSFPWGSEIYMPYAPLASVTSIAYLDVDGVSQTMTVTTDYLVDTSHEPGRIYLAYDAEWPDTRTVQNAVTITYVAGHGTAEDVPEKIKLAIKMLVGHWFEQRLPVVTGSVVEMPMHVKSLLGLNRMHTVA